MPQIAGVPVGTAIPELPTFVHAAIGELGPDFGLSETPVLEFVLVQRASSAEIIDTPGGELLAWLLERYLETLLGTAAELESYAGNHIRRCCHDTNTPSSPAAAGEEREDEGPGKLQALYNVLPKDFQLARQLLGEFPGSFSLLGTVGTTERA